MTPLERLVKANSQLTEAGDVLALELARDDKDFVAVAHIVVDAIQEMHGAVTQVVRSERTGPRVVYSVESIDLWAVLLQ